jgi:hypothetical protein
MILFFVLRTYAKDVKEIGKEHLAVSLSERLCCYFAMIGIPAISLIGYILYHSIH